VKNVAEPECDSREQLFMTGCQRWVNPVGFFFDVPDIQWDRPFLALEALDLNRSNATTRFGKLLRKSSLVEGDFLEWKLS